MVDGWCTFEMWRALHAGLVFPQVDVLFLHDFYSGHTDLSPEHPAVVLAGRFPRLKVSCLQRQEVGASQSATQAPKS